MGRWQSENSNRAGTGTGYWEVVGSRLARGQFENTMSPRTMPSAARTRAGESGNRRHRRPFILSLRDCIGGRTSGKRGSLRTGLPLDVPLIDQTVFVGRGPHLRPPGRLLVPLSELGKSLEDCEKLIEEVAWKNRRLRNRHKQLPCGFERFFRRLPHQPDAVPRRIVETSKGERAGRRAVPLHRPKQPLPRIDFILIEQAATDLAPIAAAMDEPQRCHEFLMIRPAPNADERNEFNRVPDPGLKFADRIEFVRQPHSGFDKPKHPEFVVGVVVHSVPRPERALRILERGFYRRRREERRRNHSSGDLSQIEAGKPFRHREVRMMMATSFAHCDPLRRCRSTRPHGQPLLEVVSSEADVR